MYTTGEFWLFVLAILLLHNITRGRLQNIVLLAGSYIFYAYFDLRFLALLWVATGYTFVVAQHVDPADPRRRRILILGLLFNIGVLGLFKIAHFFTDSPATPTDSLMINVLLPLGISFYSFRLLAYLLDVYNGRLQPSSSLINFALYIAFFPQIASGPIERAGRFLPALAKTRRLTQDQFATGLTYIFVGVFYKIAIANFLAGRTDTAFQSLSTLSSAQVLTAMINYSVRLYADFAGYSAMAIGVSMWFGLPAMENFRRPYFSQSVIEFWTRWHISLSTWFRDYLFYPLSRYLLRRVGSGYSFAVQAISYFVTMLVTGLWHGVSWTFVIWGAIFGIYLILERAFASPAPQELSRSRKLFNQVSNILVTDLAVCVAWMFFRADSVADALLFFQRLFQPISVPYFGWWIALLTPIALVLIIDLVQVHITPIESVWTLRLRWRVAIVGGLLLLIIILGGQALAPFVYLQF